MIKKWLMVGWVTISCLPMVHAGYRKVESVAEFSADAEDSSTMRTIPSAPPGGWAHIFIQEDGQTLTPQNHNGSFDEVNLSLEEEIQITLSKSGLPSGTELFAYTVHGGRINGEVATTLILDDTGEVIFTFKAGAYPGNYPLIIRYGGREEQINFWVNREDCCP